MEQNCFYFHSIRQHKEKSIKRALPAGMSVVKEKMSLSLKNTSFSLPLSHFRKMDFLVQAAESITTQNKFHLQVKNCRKKLEENA